jgi:hypothetical protein
MGAEAIQIGLECDTHSTDLALGGYIDSMDVSRGDIPRRLCPKNELHCSIISQGCPGFIRIKTLQLLKFCERCRSKILLVNDSIMTDDEAIHSRHAVFCRHRG